MDTPKPVIIIDLEDYDMIMQIAENYHKLSEFAGYIYGLQFDEITIARNEAHIAKQLIEEAIGLVNSRGSSILSFAKNENDFAYPKYIPEFSLTHKTT